jgi:hypothetical protein
MTMVAVKDYCKIDRSLPSKLTHGTALGIPAGAKFRVSIWCPEDNFTLRGTFMADVPTSEIYLFVFKPAVEFVGGYPVIEFPHVRDALYWSFDPRGRTRLTSEMAERIGVPYVFFESWVTGTSWSQKDYDILAEFHSAKGCDPFSCDVAVKLGYPILGYKVAAHTSLSESEVHAFLSIYTSNPVQSIKMRWNMRNVN